MNLYYQAAILPYKSLHCLQLIQNAAACVLKETVECITFSCTGFSSLPPCHFQGELESLPRSVLVLTRTALHFDVFYMLAHSCTCFRFRLPLLMMHLGSTVSLTLSVGSSSTLPQSHLLLVLQCNVIAFPFFVVAFLDRSNYILLDLDILTTFTDRFVLITPTLSS